MRRLASIIALGGLTTAVACGDDGLATDSTTGGDDGSTSSTGGGPGLTTAVTTADDTADSTGMSPDDGSTGDGSTGEGSTGEGSTGEPPADGSSSDGSTSGGPQTCGDGIIDEGEDCDDDALGGQTCESLDFDTGTLACTSRCELDTTGCVLFSCGNGVLEGKEACDGADLDGATCASLGNPGGTLACAADCTFDEVGCSVCGDGAIGDGEVCDGANLAGADCVSIGMGFFGGDLACDAGTCQYDTSACNLCGNGAIDAGEACDGDVPAGETCAGLGMGFTGGMLQCAAACVLDTSGCTSFPVPGLGDVVVSEIMYDPQVLADGSGGEWFELHNPSVTDTMQLQGCTVESNNASEAFTIDAPLTIVPGGYVVFAGTSDAGLLGFAADSVLPGGFALANGGDLVRLSCGGTLVDEVTYDDAAPWPDPPPGQSINLDPDTLDATLNDAGSAWCAGANDYFMGELGTPGAANTDCAVVPTWSIDFCRLQFPLTIDAPAGTAETVYGRVYAPGLTDGSTGTDVDAQLVAQLGYGPDASDPAVDATWTWVDAVPNPGWNDAAEPNNDEYQATLVVPAPPPADRDYAYRFSGDGGATYTYCDGDNGGSTTGYAAADAGQLTSSAAPVPELWFSEYVEGSSNNKAVEIYNGGIGDATLDGCSVDVYFNGAAAVSVSTSIAGTLGAGDTFVVCHDELDDATACDAFFGANWFNGNDAVALSCSATTLDVIGQIGSDPGSGWTIAGVSTANATIRRQCAVAAGDPDGSDTFDPSLEWVAFTTDDFTDLGTYTCP